jgi:hypothetical protein
MSRTGFVALLLLLTGKGFAQQDYFVLIQTDGKQPFYARTGEQWHNSAAGGYLIISQLGEGGGDGAYTITIGFPEDKFPEQKFSIALRHKDAGFQLEQINAATWALYNWQTRELIRALKQPKDTGRLSSRAGLKKEDAFSRLMAGVVNDTAVMYDTYVLPVVAPAKDTQSTARDRQAPALSQTDRRIDSLIQRDQRAHDTANASRSKEKPRTDSSAVVASHESIFGDSALGIISREMPRKDSSGGTVRKDSSAKNPAGGGVQIPPDKPGISKEAPMGPAIRKIAVYRSDSAWRLVYVVPGKQGGFDTVVLLIDRVRKVDSTHTPTIHSSGRGRKDSLTLREKATVSPPAAVVDSVKNPPAANPAASTGKKTDGQLQMVNSDCKSLATDYDIDKLRVKLLASDADDNKIAIARKFAKAKCFSARQVKALSELFATEEAKYRFLSAAYPFVSDADNFKTLFSLFTDEHYITLFKTLVGN